MESEMTVFWYNQEQDNDIIENFDDIVDNGSNQEFGLE